LLKGFMASQDALPPCPAPNLTIISTLNFGHIAPFELKRRASMNITLSVDEQVAQRAREAAQMIRKSLNQVVRDYLEQLAGSALRGQ
jgi:predicted HicB family RNase H-like nuclease